VADQPNPNPLSLAFLEGAVATGLARNADLKTARIKAAPVFLSSRRRRERGTATVPPISSRRAVGVVYQRDHSTHEARATREVILCGGAINSPQLLILSGIGPADHLGKLGIDVVQSLPGVGQNLQDHAAAPLLHSSKVPISLLAESSQLEAIAYVRTQDHLPAPDLQMFLVPLLWP
jgi:choline dehydrogenase